MPQKKSLKLVTTPEAITGTTDGDSIQPEQEVPQETEVQAEKPVQSTIKHTEIVWHSQANAVDVYGYTSQEILDIADKAYAFYKQTPEVLLSGEVLCGAKIIRLQYEQAVYKNVVDDSWHLPLLGVDVLPINGTIIKARVGINKPAMLEMWQHSPQKQLYRAKLLDTLKIKHL